MLARPVAIGFRVDNQQGIGRALDHGEALVIYLGKRLKIRLKRPHGRIIVRKRPSDRQRTVFITRGEPDSRKRTANLLDRCNRAGIERRQQVTQGRQRKKLTFGGDSDELAKDRPEAETGRFVGPVERAMMAIKFTFETLDPRRDLRSLLGRERQPGRTGVEILNLFADHPDDIFPVAIDVIDHDDALAEAGGFKAFVNHLECGLLLAHDKQAAPGADRISDHIDDRLAFAGARRSLDHEPAPEPRFEHRGFLRRIAIGGKIAFSLAGAHAFGSDNFLSDTQGCFEAGARRRHGF